MECKVKNTKVVIFCGLLVCCMLLTVESAPTIGNKVEVEPALHVLPLEQSVTDGLSLSSIESSDLGATASHNRNKRAIIFRPLFVYRQQQVKKQRVRDPLVPQTVR